jgi:hypothetical protein
MRPNLPQQTVQRPKSRSLLGIFVSSHHRLRLVMSFAWSKSPAHARSPTVLESLFPILRLQTVAVSLSGIGLRLNYTQVLLMQP